MQHKDYYRRNLPHFTPEHAVYFVTTRLADSLPVSVTAKLKQDYLDLVERRKNEPNLDPEILRRLSKRYIVEIDKALDACAMGPKWLAQYSVCQALQNEIAKLEQEGVIEVWCYSIMPNHLHIVFTLKNGELSHGMQLLKGRSSIVANRILERHGSFWQHESYDHILRQSEFERLVRYVLLNPVKAGLVDRCEIWPGNYLRPHSIEISAS
ncbi:MAG: transposase [Bacteroidota bacterium]|nr:transposase [Bacteroidota bacterium]MDP4231837.1 transposase [Bacteroidota bacterium]MDP4242723.1 transposase [Bacteroidota bacterium]MDP4287174.1 transposase [Bacteroidota bacterium]